eukprot:1054400-Prorocentrum_minimum.AAC.1
MFWTTVARTVWCLYRKVTWIPPPVVSSALCTAGSSTATAATPGSHTTTPILRARPTARTYAAIAPPRPATSFGPGWGTPPIPCNRTTLSIPGSASNSSKRCENV